MSDKAFDPEAYSIAIRRIVDSDVVQYAARVIEVPDLEDFADTPEEARALALASLVDHYALAMELNNPFPVAAQGQEDEYSGRITYRPSRSLHRRLAERAEREGVSLNACITELIHLGLSHPQVAPSIVHQRIVHQVASDWTRKSPFTFASTAMGCMVFNGGKTVIATQDGQGVYVFKEPVEVKHGTSVQPVFMPVSRHSSTTAWPQLKDYSNG